MAGQRWGTDGLLLLFLVLMYYVGPQVSQWMAWVYRISTTYLCLVPQQLPSSKWHVLHIDWKGLQTTGKGKRRKIMWGGSERIWDGKCEVWTMLGATGSQVGLCNKGVRNIRPLGWCTYQWSCTKGKDSRWRDNVSFCKWCRFTLHQEKFLHR